MKKHIFFLTLTFLLFNNFLNAWILEKVINNSNFPAMFQFVQNDQTFIDFVVEPNVCLQDLNIYFPDEIFREREKLAEEIYCYQCFSGGRLCQEHTKLKAAEDEWHRYCDTSIERLIYQEKYRENKRSNFKLRLKQINVKNYLKITFGDSEFYCCERLVMDTLATWIQKVGKGVPNILFYSSGVLSHIDCRLNKYQLTINLDGSISAGKLS